MAVLVQYTHRKTQKTTKIGLDTQRYLTAILQNNHGDNSLTLSGTETLSISEELEMKEPTESDRAQTSTYKFHPIGFCFSITDNRVKVILDPFEYKSKRFGYQARLQKWTKKINKEFILTSPEERAKAGFYPIWENHRNKMICNFCNTKLHQEPHSDAEIILLHVNAAPECILMQGEIAYQIRKPEYSSEESRKISFINSSRFTQIRNNFLPTQHLDTTEDFLVASGFYFAAEITVFDQMKCFHCQATIDCEIFGTPNITQEKIHQLHQENSNCAFLINKLGINVYLRDRLL